MVDRFESLLRRVQAQDVHEQAARSFENEQQGEIYPRLVDSRGRLRQQELVAQMEVLPSKIREQLAAMEEHGDVARVQVGREKIVCLPELVPNHKR